MPGLLMDSRFLSTLGICLRPPPLQSMLDGVHCPPIGPCLASAGTVFQRRKWMIGRSFCGKSAGLKMDMGACLGTGALFMRRASLGSTL